LAEQLYNAIFVGSIYALFAVGFALVFSVLDILNLAHPVVFMLGAFVALFCMSTFGLPAALAAVAAFAVTGVFGIFLDRMAFAPLRRRGAPPLSAMISSLGFAIVVIRLMELRYGADLTSYPAGSLPQTVVQIGDARVDALRLLIIGLAILLMAALTYVVRATQLGRDIRALAENPRAARLLGVDVDRAIAATFFISSGLGGVAGALLGFAYNAIYPQMGTPYELKAFTVMVVGGMGSLPGAVLGAYILGIGEIAALVFLPADLAELRDALAFGLLFLVLVIRPRGLLGHRATERS
jgi:branched-chain amino acid transport system permease protein